MPKKLKQLKELLLLLQYHHMLFHILTHHTATSNLVTTNIAVHNST
jgi:hypothetical protein